MAFDSSNNIYIAYTADGTCNVKKYNSTTNAWESFGNTIGPTIASQKIIFDEAGTMWVGVVTAAAWNSLAGNIKLFKYNAGTNAFEDTASGTNPTDSIRELDMALVKGTGQSTSGRIAMSVNNISNATRAVVYLYNKVDNSWTSTIVGYTNKAATYIHIVGDDFGNLYCNWVDAAATTAANVCAVKKLNAGQTTAWSELKNPATVRGVDEPTNNTNLGIASGSTVPYIIYTKANSAAISTAIVRKYVANTTWNGTAWSNTTGPTASLDAIIDGTYSTQTNGAITAKKLTVNAGKSLTINSGTSVTVQNEVINNGSLVVENNANLIQVLGTTNTNTGNIVVNRNSSPLLRLDYTLWSSPVAGQNLAAFSPLTSQSPSRFYTYDTANNQYSNAFDPTATNFAAGTGYLIRMPNTADSTTPTAYAGQFTGVPNNGDISFTLSTAGSGYNLVGNPYPSPITAATLVANNSTVISSTLYFWRKTNGIGTAYCTYNTAGSVFTTNGNTQSVDPTGIIQSGQGFFVQAIAPGSLVFKNEQRSTNTTGQFFKTKQVAASSRIWLNAINAAGDFSQMAVNYTEGATQGVDAFDGKYINDSPLALTSNINNDEYTIQGRPAFDASDVVPLNFKTNVAGDYTIAIDHADGLFATGQDVYLVDNTTGTETNLKTNAYTFTATTGTANSRFALKYQKTLKVDAPAFNENSVAVYKNNETLYVNSGVNNISNIKVFDIQGRLIVEQKNVNTNSSAIKNLKASQQVLIVKVTSQDNKVVNKKVVH